MIAPAGAPGPGDEETVVARYLARRQLYPFQVDVAPSPALGIVIVIPCLAEPDLGAVLESVAACEAPPCDVEIIVVINSSETAGEHARARNAATYREINDRAARSLPPWLTLHAVFHDRLPRRFAGVGLARKIGMDEAAARLDRARAATRVIASLDADCRVERNYLTSLHRAFEADPRPAGVSIYFEHPVTEMRDPRAAEALVDYELHLRCYVAGQRMAAFPYANYTLGSAIACRPDAYAAEGGMNRRSAGEDFYFVQKLTASGDYRALTDTVVYPGARMSQRVPFGTGPALRCAIRQPGGLRTYAPEVYADLGWFCGIVRAAPPADLCGELSAAPGPLAEFLAKQGHAGRLAEILHHTAGEATFRRRVLRWFNAFLFMKYAQFASRRHYPRRPVTDVAGELALRIGGAPPAGTPAVALLDWYRALDRQGGAGVGSLSVSR